MKGLQKLFDLTPQIREITTSGNSDDEINVALMKLFTEEMDDFETLFRHALEAYSVNGFFASP